MIHKILHVDMDAFFAEVETLHNPKLREHPLVVGGPPNSRSVVSSANYKARKFGICSAMPCAKAQKLCPHAVFVSPNFKRYQIVSQKLHVILNQFTPAVEPLGLDEAWLDVTDQEISATWAAKRLQKTIAQQLQLSCSVGVSFNKMLAKIASKENKPGGIFVISPEFASRFLKNLPVRKIPGIGPSTEQKLKQLGIISVQDLQQQNSAMLEQQLGKMGRYFYQLAHGIDNRQVIRSRVTKSVSAEFTFAQDSRNLNFLNQQLSKLARELQQRLNKKKFFFKVLAVKVKFADFECESRQITFPHFINPQTGIAKHASVLLHDLVNKHPKPVRLLGLRGSHLTTQVSEQLDFLTVLDP